MAKFTRHVEKIVQEDPRRVIHSLKVGFALTLVSLLYYLQPLYKSFGISAMWAIITVLLVFEFSAGATIGKCLNRGLATLVASALALGALHLASIPGKHVEPILIGMFVFVQAVASTFIRFLPKVKASYDYGMLIFILTFCLVSISGIRTNEIFELACMRILTIFIGGSTSVIVSILVYPVWAGEDLHKLVAQNIEKLGKFLEAFADEFSNKSSSVAESQNDGLFLSGLNSVLDSKNNEETLANFASWEPRHGQFAYRYPWKQYLKIGNLTRQCACRLEALGGYLNSKIQAPEETNGTIQEALSEMSSESGKALKQLARAIETMTRPLSPNLRVENLKIELKNQKSLLKSNGYLLQAIPVAVVASLLIDIAICVENIEEAINELASCAKFKSLDPNGVGEESKKEYRIDILVNESSVANQEAQSSVQARS
ncbi:aluminum-activated malate transporter 2-like [Olea europaea subsp. europaea]|uniref:Aluminum-activated malate transporter 2-like n=2 Tax=Olea europaea subsp. europaea TaxID=158383 RepID=A0A8S0PZ69_OLEEU|nr:aluminum-activated malate transporter 2-like [Olea europaea subsp. europaea]